MTKKMIFALLFALLLLFLLPVTASAASPTDEILVYDITAEPESDASVRLTYHIEWKVLESDKLGPLEWVTVGIPNGNCSDLEALSGNIDDISFDSSSGYAVRIDFDRKYYKDDVVSFDFSLLQDHLYDNMYPTDSQATFNFTPGWFNDIAVDSLRIKWRSADAESWYPSCTVDGEWLTWETSLSPGEKFEISVVYPNTLFSFPEKADTGSIREDPFYYEDDDDSSVFKDILGFILSPLALLPFLIPLLIIIRVFKYAAGRGFGTSSADKTTQTATKKQIKKTLIKYYPECPGCGAPRPENSNYCEYCGRSFIESEEVISEEDVTDKNKDTVEGDFRSEDNPNSFVRVRFVNVPIVIPVSTASNKNGSGRSCVHSSCVHSSCACACASHCACACACAGGGRAGCSAKDFYNTGLKLTQIKKHCGGGKS